MTPNRFAGKTILITGGNSGIGFATAKRVVAEGGRVIIVGRDAKTLDAAKRELGAAADSFQADVSRVRDIDLMYAKIKQTHGKLDGLFANAGIAKFQPAAEFTEEDYDRLFDVNVKGVYFTVARAIPFLNPGSSVVLNASVSGSKGFAGSTVYGATKAAVRAFARTFTAEYIAQGLRFNAISPGPIETPIWDRPNSMQAEVGAVKSSIAESNPMKRYGTVEEVTNAIIFLLSTESSYMSGSEVFVDGGSAQL